MPEKMTVHTRRRVLGLCGAAMLWPCIGRAAALDAISGSAFGTTWQMSVPAGARPERLLPAIEAAFAEVDRQMSPWRADSEVGRFNAAPSGTYQVSRATALVASASLALAERSGGSFDPTVGPLVARWGFGPITGGGPDWRGIAVHEDRLAKRADMLTMDLCGIAKGWALDRATEIARRAGHASFLFDLGGELAAQGAHPSGRDWQVAVESPLDDGSAAAVLRLPGSQSVATSGDKAQSYGIGGNIYGHIIDPALGRPASGALRSVTVMSSSAMEADGWATALFAAGAEGGPAMAEGQGISALFLIANGTGLRQVATAGMGAALL